MTVFPDDLDTLNGWLFSHRQGFQRPDANSKIHPSVRHMVWPGYRGTDGDYRLYFVNADFDDVYDQIVQPISGIYAADGQHVLAMTLDPSYVEDGPAPFYSKEVSITLFMQDVEKLLDQRSLVYVVVLDFETADKVVFMPGVNPSRSLLAVDSNLPTHSDIAADELGEDDDQNGGDDE